MKRYWLIILPVVIVLSGCISKSSFPITFDDFSATILDNKKPYVSTFSSTIIPGITILKEIKEDVVQWDTGFVNSLVVIKTTIQSWGDIKELVDSNTKRLQLKLFKYTASENTDKNIACDDKQYSWYITAFSYQLGDEILYDAQYFFIQDETLYSMSLSSDDQKDIKAFIKSIDTIKCN